MNAAVSLKADAPRRAGGPWVGRIVSALPVVALLLSASMKFAHTPKVVDMFVQHLGYQESTLLPLGLLELTCVLLYVVPRTRVFGALLLTAYLGGAVATHVRVGDPFVIPIVVGVLVWAGLYLRDPRVRALGTLGVVESSRSR
jgi:hypothetical protein